MSDLALHDGTVAPALREEFPRLGLAWVDVDARPGRSPRPVRRQLRELSSRFRGPQAVVMRQLPVPHAYRVFFRQIGLDPDVDRPPGEAAAVDRLLAGEFRSRGLVDDALLIALVETGVPVWALDAAVVAGPLTLRVSAEGERVGRGEGALPVAAGRIVVADSEGPLSVLFADLAPGVGVSGATERVRLFAVRVDGVPSIHVEEALWTCADLLAAPSEPA